MLWQVGVAAVAPLEVGAAAVVGQSLVPMLKVPVLLLLLVPLKVPVVLRIVTTAVCAVLVAAVQGV